MGLMTTLHIQKKKSSKTLSDQEIDLPVGVTFKGQEKKHRFLPKFFSSIFKSKYSEVVKATKSNQKCSQDFDSEKTVTENDLTYINSSPISEISEDENQSTIHTICLENNRKNPIQAFSTRKTLDLKGRNENTLPVLNEDLAEVIRSRLPNLLQEATTWKLLYSMDQHGATLSTLYRKIEGQGPCVMVLKNSEGEIFGAFISEAFDPSNKGFFGSPECFLWKSDNYQFKKFSATNLNQYFMVAQPSFIGMGGGKNGNFGFYLDEDIQFGYSSECDTFENEILTKNNEFECYGCEIWGLEF
jgi:hypothetical protein